MRAFGRSLFAVLTAGAVSVAVAALAPAQAQQVKRASVVVRADSVIQHVKEFGTMWTFEAPPLQYWKAQYGFDATPEWLEKVRLASVRLPNCSASFVSGEGLVMTNHHCARACITAASPPDSNFQELGFVARTREDERRCAGLYVDQLQSIEDVTARVRQAVTASTSARQVAQRDSAITGIQEQCKKDTGLTCQVISYYQGGAYSLYRFKRYDDLRLVMAPEEAVSFFGGDPDNFTFPRYDLDLTLLRVYQAGKPFQPQHYFKWSASGAKDGELIFVTGNPGSTGRLLTVAQMEYLRNIQYPAQLAGYARSLDVLRRIAKRDETTRRRLENQIFGLENSTKAVTGFYAGLKDSAIMARKRTFERDFRRRIAADPKLQARYGSAWTAIASAQRQLAGMSVPVRWYTFSGSQLLNFTGGAIRLVRQEKLADSLRLPQFRGNGLTQLRTTLANMPAPDLEQEKLTLASWLTAAQKELPAADPFLSAILAGRSPEVAAEALIGGTKLADSAARWALLDGGADAITASTDPLVVLVRKIEPLSRDVQMRAARLNDVVSANAELVGQAIYAAYGKTLPPDATFSLRISDGVVRGFPMNGTVAPYKTTYYGLFARSAEFDNVAPFRLPPRWQQQMAKVDMKVPLNFVSTNDIIGGNSGSPVINRNAEIVGLIFDGNIQQLPNRFIYTDDDARAVSVHSAGIVEALRSVYGAERIAGELIGAASSGKP